MANSESVTIAERFRGPPRSGNGGYVCGVLGMRLPSPSTVRLLAPPPLETALQVESSGDGLRLLHGATPIAQARAAALAIDPPQPPSLAEARAASAGFAGATGHPFPGCFVCGPERVDGDGLRIFPGAVAGRALVAAPWTPHPNLGDDDGRVRPEFAWSALDCTGFFSFGPLPDGAPALLGELSVRLDSELEAGAPHVVVGWLLGSEGRKRFAGSAVFSERGELRAVARATWIVVASGTAGSVT